MGSSGHFKSQGKSGPFVLHVVCPLRDHLEKDTKGKFIQFLFLFGGGVLSLWFVLYLFTLRGVAEEGLTM